MVPSEGFKLTRPESQKHPPAEAENWQRCGSGWSERQVGGAGTEGCRGLWVCSEAELAQFSDKLVTREWGSGVTHLGNDGNEAASP